MAANCKTKVKQALDQMNENNDITLEQLLQSLNMTSDYYINAVKTKKIGSKVVMKREMYPMWSYIFQVNVERFTIDVPSVAGLECEEIEPMYLTNASVKSHFRSVKHGRLSGRRRIHPYQFVAAELEYVNGKLNQLKLPKLTTKRRKDESEKEEHWGERKCHTTYTDLSHTAKLLKNLMRSKNRLPHRLLRRELANMEIQRIHNMLQRSFRQYDGLAEPGLR